MTPLFTKPGYEKIKKDLDEAEKKRPEAVKTLARARAMGDLSENGFYKGARQELSDLDRKIRELNHLLKVGRVMGAPTNNKTVQFGHKVVLERN